MSNKWIMYTVIFLAGVALASRVRALPVLNKIPAI